MDTISPAIAAEINRIYKAFPPYLEFSKEQIFDLINHYSRFPSPHYPDLEPLEWRILQRKKDGCWALCFSDGTKYFITVMGIPEGEDLRNALAWLLSNIPLDGAGEIVFGSIRDPFGLGWCGLPATVKPQIDLLSSDFNFRILERWTVYALKNLQDLELPDHRDFPEDYQFIYREDTQLGEWEILVYHASEQVGECQAWSIPPYFDTLLEKGKWRTVEWVGVESPYRKKGLGSHLLLKQLAWQKNKGIDHLVVWTEIENVAARAMLVKLGFQAVETYYTLSR